MFAPFDLSRIIQIVFPFFPIRPPTQCFRTRRPSSTILACSKEFSMEQRTKKNCSKTVADFFAVNTRSSDHTKLGFGCYCRATLRHFDSSVV